MGVHPLKKHPEIALKAPEIVFFLLIFFNGSFGLYFIFDFIQLKGIFLKTIDVEKQKRK